MDQSQEKRTKNAPVAEKPVATPARKRDPSPAVGQLQEGQGSKKIRTTETEQPEIGQPPEQSPSGPASQQGAQPDLQQPKANGDKEDPTASTGKALNLNYAWVVCVVAGAYQS